MTDIDKNENTDLLEKSIDYLVERGYDNIKADIKGFETPKYFKRKGHDEEITPDIVAEKHGKKNYFEVGVKSQRPNLLKSKWKFLDTFAQMKGNNFRIITHRGHYAYTKNLIEDINLDKSLIKL